jgi:hypothetical protein
LEDRGGGVNRAEVRSFIDFAVSDNLFAVRIVSP